jgi:SAM-dependent methyltransferase
MMAWELFPNLEEWFRWSEEWSMLLRVFAGLRSDGDVLEIGCGLGRIAVPLRFLLHGGSYRGFDIVREKIDFLSCNFPTFQFTHVNLRNTYYNPTGTELPETLTFPYADRSFNVVFAASVFTHMTPRNAARYFAETARVLKPNGRVVFSFFILDHYSPAQRRYQGFASDDFKFETEFEDYGRRCAITRADNPEFMTAYSGSLIHELAVSNGLQIVHPIIPGLWSGRFANPIATQDVVVLETV